MSLAIVVVLLTVYFVLSLLSLYWAVHTLRGYLRKAVHRIRKQRNEDLRWRRDTLLAQMRLERAMQRQARRRCAPTAGSAETAAARSGTRTI